MAFKLPAPGVAAAARAPLPESEPAATGSWTREDTERWLTDYPLPATFFWNGTRAYPHYALKRGYGFWLRTAGPYHAALRGLFVLCHDVLAALRPGIDPMPSGDQLAAILKAHERVQTNLPFSAEDQVQIAPGTPNPAENAPGTQPEPSDEPDTAQF